MVQSASTRAIKQVELETIEKNIDWGRLASILRGKVSNRGSPETFSKEQKLRIVILQDKLQVPYDTDMERLLKGNRHYREFCKLGKDVPSHDTLTRFKKLNEKRLKNLFDTIDKCLEELGYFEDDELCGDGTDIELSDRCEMASWGAKSNDEKFCGMWLLTANSTNKELARDFAVGTGKDGQINIGKKLLKGLKRKELNEINDLSMDGIFDTKDIRKMVKKDLKLTPVIPYNPRKSKVKKAEDLPNDNWRLKYTPFLKDKGKFKKRYKRRTASERENSRIKLWTLLGKLKEKTTIAWKTSGVYIVAQSAISLISMQISALAQWIENIKHPVPEQITLAEAIM